jgi:hypothetical protein
MRGDNMVGGFGLIRCNFHWVKLQLDASNKVYSGTLLDRISLITNGVNMIQHTISADKYSATISESGYGLGSTVYVMLSCSRSAEDGGFCTCISDPRGEETMQEYLDIIDAQA